MKIRNDFISNSSSCSFIVDDGKSTLKAFKKLKIKYFPSCLENTGFTLYGSQEKLIKIVKKLELFRNPSLCYDGKYDLNDLTFMQILSLNANDLKDISINVSAEVYDEGNAMFVRLLCKYLTNEGLKIEDTGDYSLGLDGENESFLLNLMNVVLSKDKKNED